MSIENEDYIIDVDYIEKESTTIPNDNDTEIIISSEQTNQQNNYEYDANYQSTTKVIKLNSILAILLFIVICVLGFMFLGVIALVAVVIIGIGILASFVLKISNKFKK